MPFCEVLLNRALRALWRNVKTCYVFQWNMIVEHARTLVLMNRYCTILILVSVIKNEVSSRMAHSAFKGLFLGGKRCEV